MASTTDRARLEGALKVLRRHGYFARGDIEGTRTDAWAEVGDDETPAVMWTTQNARGRFKGSALSGSLQLQWRGDPTLIALVLRRAGLRVSDATDARDTITVRGATAASLASAAKQPPLPRPARAANLALPAKRKAGRPRLSKVPSGRTQLTRKLALAIQALEATLKVWLNKSAAAGDGFIVRVVVFGVNDLRHLSDDPRSALPVWIWNANVPDVRAVLEKHGIRVLAGPNRSLRIPLPR